ncbi:MAG: hypothetical protein D6681_06840 [Calditrichaeota bacterium]|nr:MAG: hypothetical protein D6681_06840 [Calditrichota bacterium]
MVTQKEALKQVQEEIADTTRKIFLAGLGAFATIEEEGSKLFGELVKKGQELVEKGETVEKKGMDYVRETVEEVRTKADTTVKAVEEKVHSLLGTLGLSDRDEVRELSEKVEKLTQQVAALNRKLDAERKARTASRN